MRRSRLPALCAPACLALCCALLACADMATTAAVVADAVLRNEAARRTADQQPASTQAQATLVQVVQTQAFYDASRRPALSVQVRNGSRYEVTAMRLRVLYFNGAQVIGQDESCVGSGSFPPGQTIGVVCPYVAVQGANSYRVDVSIVQFR